MSYLFKLRSKLIDGTYKFFLTSKNDTSSFNYVDKLLNLLYINNISNSIYNLDYDLSTSSTNFYINSKQIAPIVEYLVVAGGGGGGCSEGGGGGGGGVLNGTINQNLLNNSQNTVYIVVGNGGNAGLCGEPWSGGSNGYNSSLGVITAIGGGGGGRSGFTYQRTPGKNGGSGGAHGRLYSTSSALGMPLQGNDANSAGLGGGGGGGAGYAVLTSGSGGSINNNTFSVPLSIFPNDGTLINKYMLIQPYNYVYKIVQWLSADSLRVLLVSCNNSALSYYVFTDPTTNGCCPANICSFTTIETEGFIDPSINLTYTIYTKPTVDGGDGGNGRLTDIEGQYQYYGGGGAGGVNSPIYSFYGGLGGGGQGGSQNQLATNGTDNTGGGGGGDSGSSPGRGGSGIVIIAYQGSLLSNISNNLTYTLDTTSRPGYKIYKFLNGSGNITF